MPDSFTLEMLPQIASNPGAMAALIVVVVKWIREQFPSIDGKVLVASIAAGVGAVLGLGVDMAGLLAYQDMQSLPGPSGGVVYGAVSGLMGFTGVNLFDLIFRRKDSEEGES